MSALNLWNDKLFSDDFFADFFDFEGPRRLGNNEGARGFSPACNVSEAKEHYVLSFDLPGMQLKDINVEVDRDALIVSGERKYEKQNDDEKIHRIERGFGSFRRAFRVPEGLSEDHIAASYKDGVLKIAVAKMEPEEKSRKINIADGDDSFFKKLVKNVTN